VAAIRVLIVDDSAVVRKQLTAIFDDYPDIEVVGTAPDPFVARRRIKELEPDVLTLDVEMPRMDGLTFLSNLMRLRPMPVVMVSTLTQKGADVTLRALELGAFDFVSKPTMGVEERLQEYADELATKVRAASRANVERLGLRSARAVQSGGAPVKQTSHFATTNKIIAIGASTGGTEAVADILAGMPADAPGIVVTQHLPGSFSEAFAKRLDGQSAMRVRLAGDRETIRNGNVYIAPGGDHHLAVHRNGADFICRLEARERVSGHRPSVDVLFDSVATKAGRNAVGVLLTGMGADGAAGLKAMRDSGAPTICQDEATSVVWGMPGVAVKMGAACEVLPLERIGAAILKAAR